MPRLQIAAGNWKMNTRATDAKQLAEAVMQRAKPAKHAEVIFAVPAPFLIPIAQLTDKEEGYYTAAQNCHHEAKGAYTGEISATMVQSTGADFVVLGHSERREYNGETAELLAAKLRHALDEGLQVIFCCGEPLEVRQQNQQNDYVVQQLKDSFGDMDEADMRDVILAYEPIWAIGTGETATPEQAQEMHANLRAYLREAFGDKTADNTSILYGGSVKPGNAKELFGQPDVDGGLVGGASLKADDFVQIIEAL